MNKDFEKEFRKAKRRALKFWGFVTLFLYACSSLIAWSANIGEWHWGLRLLYVVLVIIAGFIVFLALISYHDDLEKKDYAESGQKKKDFEARLQDAMLKQEEKHKNKLN